MQEEGLGDFLESAGFRAEFEIRPIQQEEDCDYMDPTAMDWKRCGKKASYAKYILDTSCIAQSMQPRPAVVQRTNELRRKVV